MGFGMPRRSSSELMQSPMPPWMQRITSAGRTVGGASRNLLCPFFVVDLYCLLCFWWGNRGIWRRTARRRCPEDERCPPPGCPRQKLSRRPCLRPAYSPLACAPWIESSTDLSNPEFIHHAPHALRPLFKRRSALPCVDQTTLRESCYSEALDPLSSVPALEPPSAPFKPCRLSTCLHAYHPCFKTPFHLNHKG